MLDQSVFNLVLIRGAIILLQYTPAIEALVLGALLYAKIFFLPTHEQHHGHNHGHGHIHDASRGSSSTGLTAAIAAVTALLAAEAVYAVALYLPHHRRLQEEAAHPEGLSRASRADLFARCAANVRDWDRYLRVWFMEAPSEHIRRDNMRDFVLWAFFDGDVSLVGAHLDGEDGGDGEDGEDGEDEIDGFVRQIEGFLGRPFAPGRGPARAFRLTLDAVDTRYRSVIWYGFVVAAVDLITHASMALNGFAYYAPPGLWRRAAAVFPPTGLLRGAVAAAMHPSSSLSRFASGDVGVGAAGSGGLEKRALRSSPSSEVGYWYRLHRSRTRLPVVFMHGIGVGLWPYTRFLDEISRGGDDGDDKQVGVIALEVLPISTRLTSRPLTQHEFVRDMSRILAQHGPEWMSFVLVSHSYGSVLTTHMLRSPDLGPRVRAAVLVDPVTLLLHLPDVAYNFTRRAPRTANEWQLWYFASMDLGVAETLARHFFWRENIIWREELLELKGGGSSEGGGEEKREAGGNSLSRRRLRAETQGSSSSGDSDSGSGSGSQSTKKLATEAGEKRKVAVCLSGRDLIVDTRTIAMYLASEGDFAKVPEEKLSRDFVSGNPGDRDGTFKHHTAPSEMEILWFGQLDHAQVFDERQDRSRVVEVVRRFCWEAHG
ncbi:hypothetical protein B0T26DRAFT_715370 [Lasiosphaeria miniovina]|uniref:AB hydrolase-1 domain-containing protein n=1 Tax=Lasiosphaeria miniovina TaxID=1954250 RepID=A0AA40ABH0_9PEZI|nr:uncharacterized protein B0T26DRAFT_715370 [Lasiosphaeria miniovina]KAK0712829.1 hypothetical protein B0T26DRAFT_715370 [Lasiosphaeria miniovina]